MWDHIKVMLFQVSEIKYTLGRLKSNGTSDPICYSEDTTLTQELSYMNFCCVV
jgi:hypothetical protein